MAAARVCENQDMQDTQNIQEFCGTIRKPLPGPLFGQHRGQALCAAGHRAPRAQPPAEKMPRHCLMCAAARRGRSRQKEKMARPRATQAAPVPRRENLPGPGWAPTEARPPLRNHLGGGPRQTDLPRVASKPPYAPCNLVL
ncbi:unnamed protein product [Prorocentrum cordatum]|uniref:Uncharacterized protein n=1 Tax=Prorocentrum cordatum TaxID=2364126 RepID=A0ABN9VLZ8_9DINO|nr:unnamed protein product [Polarella glacialis]